MTTSIRELSGGKLKPDAIGDKGRLARLPGAAVLLSLFRAEHNHIADKLAEMYPAQFGAKHSGGAAAADEVCFQQSRSIVLAIFSSILFADYIAPVTASEGTCLVFWTRIVYRSISRIPRLRFLTDSICVIQ
jgi:hypothetical protein